MIENQADEPAINPGDTVEMPLDSNAKLIAILDGVALVESRGVRYITRLSGLRALAPLPTEPGTVITWLDGAYLPQLAQLDAGEMKLGWWTHQGDEGRWLNAKALAAVIGDAEWQALVPEGSERRAAFEEASSWIDLHTYGEPVLAKVRAFRERFGLGGGE